MQIVNHLLEELQFIVQIGIEHHLNRIAAAGFFDQFGALDLIHMPDLGRLLAGHIGKHHMIRRFIIHRIAHNAHQRREGREQHDHQRDGDHNAACRQQRMPLLCADIAPCKQRFKFHCVHRLTVRSSHRG